ncbi:MAG: helix-turn-helix transcriptional regulator [Nitrososphaerota archaeon]|nr:helix-turn-helix transcriptional regulator [Nitrososphaerota archaeon]
MEITDPARVQALVQGLADEYSRRILLSAISKAKSVEDMSRENDIPLSTAYRRIHELLDAQMLVVERIIVTPDGKKYELLRSSYRAINVAFDGEKLKVDAVINEDVAEKLRRLWLSMRQVE